MRLHVPFSGNHLKLLVGGLLVTTATAALPAPPRPRLAQVPPQIVAEFARCVAKRHRREATDYVLRTTPSWTQAAVRARRKLADARCIPAQAAREEARALLSTDEEDHLRARVAEALVREDFPTFEASLILTAQPLGYDKLVDALWPPDGCKNCKPAQAREFQQARARSSALLAPLVLGECVARSDPASAYKLVTSDAGSADESAAVHAVRPALEHCVLQGVKFKITSGNLRDSLALNYYRLARAPRGHTQP